MKHKLRRSCLMLTLAMLCTLLYAGAASASSPQLSVKVDGADVDVTATTTDYTGRYYYMVEIATSTSVSSFQTGWNSDVDANQPEQWETQTESICYPVIGGEEDNGKLIEENAFFVRKGEGSPVQKLVFHYDNSQKVENPFEITGTRIELLNGEAELSWPQQENAAWGWVTWTMPNGDERFCGLREDDELKNELKLTDFWESCEPEDMIAQPGRYTATVQMLAGGKLLKATKNFTVSMPPSGATPPVLEIYDNEADAWSTQKTVEMYTNVSFRAKLPESVDAKEAEVQIIIGSWLNDRPDYDDDDHDKEYNYWYTDWTPDYEETTTVQAYARYRTDDNGPWTYSEPISIEAKITGEIKGKIKAASPVPATVARNQMLNVEITNILGENVSRYGAYLLNDDGDWITDSNWVWVDPEEEQEGTTVVSVPVANCEVGESYDVYAYAIKDGAAEKAAKVGRVRVTESEGDNTNGNNDNGLLIVMKDDNQYNLNERADFYAYYTKADEENGFNPEDRLRMKVSIVRLSDNKEVESWNSAGNSLRNEARFAQSGNYRVTAILYCSKYENGAYGDEYDVATSTREFTVISSGELMLPDDYQLFGTAGECYIPSQGDSYQLNLAELERSKLNTLNTKGVSSFEVNANVWVDNDSDGYGTEKTWKNSDNEWSISIDTSNNAKRANLELRIYAKDENGIPYDEKYLETSIPVITAEEDKDNHKIELTVEPANGEGITNVNQRMNIQVKAEGAKEIRLADSDDSDFERWDAEELEDNAYTVFCDWRKTSWRPGPYQIWAVATYEDGTEFRSEIQTFRLAEPQETVDEFTISTSPATVERGEPVTVTFTDANQEGVEYGVDLWAVDDEDEWQEIEGDWDWIWTEENQTAVINTVGLPVGEYRIKGWGNKEGCNSYSTDDDDREAAKLTVVEPDLSYGEILLQVNNGTQPVTAKVDEDILFSAYAPGADYIELFCDFMNNQEDKEDNEGDEVTDALVRKRSYYSSGTYQVVARAHYTETIGGSPNVNDRYVDSDPITVTVSSANKLFFGADTTATLTGNELTITAKLPTHAEKMSVRVEVYRPDDNPDEEGTWTTKFKWEGTSAEYNKTIDTADWGLQEGDEIHVYFDAWGTGYEGAEFEAKIPVLGAASEQATLAFTGTNAEATSTSVIINQEVEVQVTPADDSQTIKEYEIVGIENEEYYDEDSCKFSFDDPGQYTIYATVTFNGATTPVTTNSLTVTVTSKGSVAAFDFNPKEDVTVKKGTDAKFTFTKSTDATDYWVDLEQLVDGKYEYVNDVPQDFKVGEGTVTVTATTTDLEVGTYRVRGKAGGAQGYEDRESNSTVLLTVVGENDPAYQFDWPETFVYNGENKPTVTVWKNVAAVGVNVGEGLVKTPATCTDVGEVQFTATVNDGSNYSETHSYTIPKTPHNYGDWFVDDWNDDCTDFTATRKCKNDGCTRTETFTGDKRVVTSTTATCEKEGTITYTPQIYVNDEWVNLAATNPVNTDPLGHDWNDWVITPATCTKPGSKTRTCNRDGCAYHTAGQTVDIPALNHNWALQGTTDPNCTTDGKEVYKCTNGCGKTNEITIPATGHKWGEATYDWTETATGYECTASHTCSNENCPLQEKKETVTVTAAKKQGETACDTVYTAAFGTEGFTTRKETFTKHKSELVHHDAVEAQVGVAGKVEYWSCASCSRNYSDAAGTTELASVVVAALPQPSQPSQPADTTITIPVSGEGKDAATVNVTVEVKDNTATVTSADVDDVLNAKDVGNVTIDLSSLGGAVDEVVLPAELVKKIATAVANKNSDASGLEIKLPTGTITLDATAVADLAAKTNGKEVKLHLDRANDNALTSKQKNTIKDLGSLLTLDAHVVSNGMRIGEFGGGKITLNVSYKLHTNQRSEGVEVWYVDEEGKKEEVACKSDGKDTAFTVSHLSIYVIAYNEEKAQKAAEEAEAAKVLEDTVKTLNELPAASDVKLTDKEAIEKARAAYNALSDEQKEKVSPETLKKLTDAEDALKALEQEPQPEPGKVTYDDLSKAEKKQADELVKALGVDKDTAAAMVKLANGLGVSLDTVKLSAEALAKMDVDSSDPKGTDFGKLTARVTKRDKKTLTLKWAKQKDAEGYLIYSNKCGKGNKMKLIKTIKKDGTVSFTQKKLKKGTYYKFIVVAYRDVNGYKMPIAASVVVHVPTKGGKTTVAKSVKTTQKKKNVTKVTVKKGKSVNLKASEVLEEKKLKLKTHRAVKFESSNPKIAKVNAKGKITGKKKGTCTVWAYAQNGIFKAIKVTVK